jgi:hypothetical protein
LKNHVLSDITLQPTEYQRTFFRIFRASQYAQINTYLQVVFRIASLSMENSAQKMKQAVQEKNEARTPLPANSVPPKPSYFIYSYSGQPSRLFEGRIQLSADVVNAPVKTNDDLPTPH